MARWGSQGAPSLWLSADVEHGVADSQGVVGAVHLDHADDLVAGSGSDLHAVGGQLGPLAGSDGRAVGHLSQGTGVSLGLVVALVAGHNLRQHQDGGLALGSGSGHHSEALQNRLAAVVVHGVGLLVEHEAVIDDTALDQPAGDAGRVVVTICYPIGSLSDSSYGFP